MTVSWGSVPTKRIALHAFVGSIVLSALLGIWALLSGDFDDVQVKVLLSSLSVSAASLCAMGGAALLESRGERLPALPAILLAAVALVLVLFGLWAERGDEPFWKATATLCFFAVACAHASLLRLARLAPRYAWLGPTAVVLVLALASLGAFALWVEADDEAFFRALGVLSILVAAATLATPVFHRLSRDDLALAGGGPAADGVAMLCPACGAGFRHALGDVDCPRCGARFRVEMRAG